MLYDKLKIVFVLGQHGGFYEGGISISNKYCCVRIYNKDKTVKNKVDFSYWRMPSTILSIILMCM